MNTNFAFNFILPLVFVWVGFVCAISFMEAWLKFQAPGVTTQTGLGIGRLVFSSLNKVEISFSIAILLCLFLAKPKGGFALYFLFLSMVVLVVQSIWLLPKLDERAQMIIQNIKVKESKIHILYVILELIKVISLMSYGLIVLKNKINGNY